MSKMNMAKVPNLGFLDAILYLEREEVDNDLVEAFVLQGEERDVIGQEAGSQEG
jgi:hypothetical protein